MVKNLPVMRETWVQTLGWEDPLEKGKAAHSSILEDSMAGGVWQATDPGVTKRRTRLSDFQFRSFPAGPLGAFNSGFDYKPLVLGPSPHPGTS